MITVFGSFSLALLLSLTQCSRVSTENAVLKHDTQNLAGKIREQDTTILKLTTEKASLENQAAVAASIPLHVPSIISNLDNILATEPTNRQQLLSLLYSVEALTNALVAMALRPTFDLYINDIKITNNTLLDLKSPRILNLLIINTSAIALEQLTVDFDAPFGLDPTNVTAPGWSLGPQTMATKNGNWTQDPIGNHWLWRADTIVADTVPNHVAGYYVNAIKISTNISSPVIEVGFHVVAARSRGVNYKVILKLNN